MLELLLLASEPLSLGQGMLLMVVVLIVTLALVGRSLRFRPGFSLDHK